MKADFRIATPSEKESLWGKNPEYREDKYILVSGDNSTVSKANRLLPSHFLLSDGTMMKRLSKPRVIDHKKSALKTHAQMYADMFLYVPWKNEEQFLGEAWRSEERCAAMWEVYGQAAMDLEMK